MNRELSFLLITGLILGSGPAVWAASTPRKEGPVESASATLSETISAHQAEQHELMRMHAQEFALFRQGAFLEPLSPPAPAVVVEEGPSPALGWLIRQGDPSVTGFQPVAGREGLLVSYTIPTTDPLAFLRGRSWTYDNAVGAIALLLQGQPDAAYSVLAALQGLMAPDGSLGFSYQVDSSFVDGRVRTGTLAWVGYAMALYQRQTGDSSFQASAEGIGAYLKNLQVGSGSIKGGPDVSWISTEHNVDAYFFYRELYRVTGQASYLTTAVEIRDSLLTHHWVQTSKNSGHFLQGIGDPTPSLDANAWGAMFAAAVGETAKANQALKYVESTFKNTQRIAGTPVRVTGYSPDSAKKTVWVEGTAGVAAAYQRVGQVSRSGSILSEISELQSAWESLGKWNGALPYASPRYTNPDGDTFSDLESVPSTGWYQIALSVRNDPASSFWNLD